MFRYVSYSHIRETRAPCKQFVFDNVYQGILLASTCPRSFHLLTYFEMKWNEPNQNKHLNTEAHT